MHRIDKIKKKHKRKLRAMKKEAIANDVFFQTYQKSVSLYEKMFQEKLSARASEVADVKQEAVIIIVLMRMEIAQSKQF